jgi:Zn-finger nucleic acid-binding protein
MNCPKCNAGMEKITHGTVEIDRCTNCVGIWFDRLEREHLARLKGSENIDVGNVAIARGFEMIDHIDCPVCRSPMIRMVDPVQPHIWYEACTVCNGIFLDAGEFRDLKERTIADRLRDLLTPTRR